MLTSFAMRSVRRWRSIYLMCAIALLLLLLYYSGKHHRDKEALQQSSTGTPNQEGLPRILSDKAIVSPFRRSPVPSVDGLSDGIPDEENHAKEMDVDPKNKAYDVYGNAAYEEEGSVENLEKDYINYTDDLENAAAENDKNKVIKSAEKDTYDENFHQMHEDPMLGRSGDVLLKEVEDQPKKGNGEIRRSPISKPAKKEVADEESFHQLPEHQKELPEDKYGAYNNWRNLTLQEISQLSRLGRRLFLNEKLGQEQNKKFKIHFWRHIKLVEKRLLKGYGNSFIDPFEDCSVSNCEMTYDDGEVTSADAVIFHLHRLAGPPSDVPRSHGQLWIWMSDESPYNVLMTAKDKTLNHYNGYFNWSMTYRMDSDVPVPYGRTVPLPKDKYLENVEDFFSKKSKNITILGSNCGGRNGRYEFIKDLKKYIPVDIYGACGPLKCPGHFNKDCLAINDYKFYLAFENSNCDDYVTEKVWWNALHKGAVPVVMGASKRNYEKLLPPGSFIYAEDFDTPKHLAQYLRYLLENAAAYSQYHQWRRRYRVLNEHGYFQSPVYHFCRACEALNYNERSLPKTSDLSSFFDPLQHCYPSKWRPS